MGSSRTGFSLFCSVLLFVVAATPAGWAQTNSKVAAQRASPENSKVEVSAGELHEQVSALRDNVLRIRVWRGNTPPEDASWAVLAAARTSSVAAAVQSSRGYVRLQTNALIAEVNKATLELTVRDPAGNLIQKDAS